MKTLNETRLTKQQVRCVEYGGRDLLIRGIPGSGKTTVLLRRARKLAEGGPPGTTVRVFTFNKSLAKFSRELVAGLDNPAIEVITFHKWATQQLRRAGIYPNVVQGNDRERAIAKALHIYTMSSRHNAKVATLDMAFWSDEFTWIKGQLIDSVEAYLTTERIGRGKALQTRERRAVWSVFALYEIALGEQNQMDWDDFAPMLLKRLDSIPASLLPDHVLVDEAQDLHQAQLLVLRRVAQKTLTIAADEGQKIYRTTFSWQSIGINVRGVGSKRLTTTFRSTRQIVALAASLRQHDHLVVASGPDALEYDLPKADGPPPLVFAAQEDLEEEEEVLKLVRVLLDASPGAAIGLLARSWKTLYRMHVLLKEKDIQFEDIREDQGRVTSPGLKITTFHSAKGLEFDFVVLVRLNEGIIPKPLRGRHDREMTSEDLEDYLDTERRLLYVSMTRAKFGLYMTHSRPPSRFLDELDPDLYTLVTPSRNR